MLINGHTTEEIHNAELSAKKVVRKEYSPKRVYFNETQIKATTAGVQLNVPYQVAGGNGGGRFGRDE